MRNGFRLSVDGAHHDYTDVAEHESIIDRRIRLLLANQASYEVVGDDARPRWQTVRTIQGGHGNRVRLELR
jgi:hypothetical protein